MRIFLDSLSTKSKTGSGMQPSLRSLASGASQVGARHSHTWCLWSWWVHAGLPRNCLAGTLGALVALVSDEARDEMRCRVQETALGCDWCLVTGMG